MFFYFLYEGFLPVDVIYLWVSESFIHFCLIRCIFHPHSWETNEVSSHLAVRRSNVSSASEAIAGGNKSQIAVHFCLGQPSLCANRGELRQTWIRLLPVHAWCGNIDADRWTGIVAAGEAANQSAALPSWQQKNKNKKTSQIRLKCHF